jgi:hypothetical protein
MQQRLALAPAGARLGTRAFSALSKTTPKHTSHQYALEGSGVLSVSKAVTAGPQLSRAFLTGEPPKDKRRNQP